jgi:transcriptional regulator with GAF, ATPase, and Fis domain
MPRHDQTLPIASVERTFNGFSLVVRAGPDAGKRAVAEGIELAVGTDPANALVLTDPRVSRHHVSVQATNKGFLVKDLGSRNGTWSSGMRIEVGYLQAGASFEIGHSVIRLEPDQQIKEPLSPSPQFGQMLGASEAMRRIFAVLPRLETGTGKGALALAIHSSSPRAKGPFVVLDCTAIPPSLVESELFGHVAGAFTGATKDRAGAFEVARGGTIFIDEIGELPQDMQPKLLRALEERTVKPLGSARTVQLDVRVIAATNRDLRAEVNEGTFRADLYYRLNVVRLKVPPLRERRDDIVLLAKHFYEELAPGRPMPAATLASFMHQSWPGNVRELRGAVERALLLEDLAPDALDNPVPAAPAEAQGSERVFDPKEPFRDAKAAATAEWEKWYVGELMRYCEGNVSKASRIAQMDRSYLRAVLKKHGISARTTDEEP